MFIPTSDFKDGSSIAINHIYNMLHLMFGSEIIIKASVKQLLQKIAFKWFGEDKI